MRRGRATLPLRRWVALIAGLWLTAWTASADPHGLDAAEDFPLDIATPPSAGFDPVPPDAFLKQAREIADWIVARTAYPPDIPLPAFVLLPRASLNYIFYSQLVGGYQGQDCINALYLPHLMLLAEDFDVTSCSDTLVHEMVHHFQFITEKPFRCTAEAEYEAYHLQSLWTEETGIGIPPSQLFMRRLTCDNPHEWGLRKPAR
jgi:hypothetical protein